MKNFKYVPQIDVPFEIVSYKTSKSIKIYVKDGYIKVTKPKWYSEKKALKFIKNNRESIMIEYEKNIQKVKKNNLLQQDYLYLFGKKYELRVVQYSNSKGAIEVNEDAIVLYIPNNISISNKEFIELALINQMYKNNINDVIGIILHKYCGIMKIDVPNYRIKSCKTIWGSCSSKGNLNFNLKLAMLPKNIIEHIVIHELCHIKYMNHGEKFWNCVYSYCSKEEYKLGKKWIKEHIQK